ncbi:MAG: hypothetical protein V7603_3965 [Micromonosporaceae bacterium]
MMDENVLSAALHELADRDQVGAPPIDRLVHLGRRSRHARNVGAATAAAAIAALVAVAVVTASADNKPAVRNGTGSLVLAAQLTSRSTFRFTTTETLELRTGMLAKDGNVVITQGAFDPVGRRANLSIWTGGNRSTTPCTRSSTAAASPGASRAPVQRPAVQVCAGSPTLPMRQISEERQIGDDCFLRGVGPGIREPWQLTGDRCGFTSIMGVDLSTTPQRVLDRIKTIGSAVYRGRTGSGPDATDTWAFSYGNPENAQQRPDTVTGTVVVNVATGLIARIRYHMVVQGGPSPIVEDVDIKFSDYGTPVVVSAPPSYLPPPPNAPTPFPSGTR